MRSNAPEGLFQFACRKLDHGRATVGTGARGLACFQLAHQFLHFQRAEELTRFNGRALADHLHQARFKLFAHLVALLGK